MKIIAAVCLFSISLFCQWVPVNTPPDMWAMLGFEMNHASQNGLAGGYQFGPVFDGEARIYYTTNKGADWLPSSFPDSTRAVTQFISTSFNGSSKITHLAPGAKNLVISTNYQPAIRGSFSFINLRSDAALRLGITGQPNSYRGIILSTTNNGRTWQKFGTMPDSCTYVKRITKLDSANDLFVIAIFPDGDRVLHSADLGNTWTTKLALPDLFLNDIVHNCNGDVIAVGGIIDTVNPRGIVYFNSPGRNHDTVVYPPEFAEIKTVSSTCLESYTIAGYSITGSLLNSVIYQSNNGLDWTKIPFNGTNVMINRIRHKYAPLNAGAIMVADNFEGGGWSSIIYSNAPQYGSNFTPVQFIETPSGLWFIDAYITSFNDTYIYGTTGISAALLYNSNSNLPVKLTSFTAEQKGNTVHLVWETAAETNNQGFDLERKTDGVEYSSITTIQGSGSSTEKQKYTFTDTPDADANYTYRLKQVDFDGRFSYSEAVNISFTLKPSEFYLSKNYPNPFNPETKIDYGVPVKGYITLAVYDILGNRIAVLAEGVHEAGNYSVVFNAANLSSGTYIYRLTSGGTIKSGRMTLLK